MRNYIGDFIYACRVTLFRDFRLGFTGPSRLHIALTYMCNSRCRMCSIWKIYRENREKLREEFKLREFERIIEKYPKFRDIWLTGGEPMLRKDFVDIVDYIDKNTSAWYTFQTNAILVKEIKRKVEEVLKRAGRDFGMGISIDGFEKTHDMQRGVRGNWKNAIELLDWTLKKAEEHSNFHPSVTITVTKWNVKELPDFIDWLIARGVKPKSIGFVIAATSQTYYHNRESFAPPRREAIKAVEEVMKRHREFRTYYYRGMIKYLKKPFKMKCYAAFSFNYVDPYLNVYPCIYFNEPIGNLRDFDYDFEELWRSEKARELRERVRKLQCPPCPWNSCVVSPNMASDPVLGMRKVVEKFLL